MKIVKELDNGKLLWFDTEGYREATAQEIEEKEARIEKIKQEKERLARIKQINGEIFFRKTSLERTDYKQAKWLDGALSEEEYAPIRARRQQWRDEINALEDELASL